MRNVFCCLALVGVGAVVHAADVVKTAAPLVGKAEGSATVTCGAGGVRNGQAPILNVTYTPTNDVGTPGLFALGVLTPAEDTGAILTTKGWINYKGGLYPFLYRYDKGLPASITVKIPFPDGALNTSAYVGYGVFAGHGAYTAKGKAAVADRRKSLNEAKATLVSEGAWDKDFSSDIQYIYSLVQQDAVDNKKYKKLITVPYIDCSLSVNLYGGHH